MSRQVPLPFGAVNATSYLLVTKGWGPPILHGDPSRMVITSLCSQAPILPRHLDYISRVLQPTNSAHDTPSSITPPSMSSPPSSGSINSDSGRDAHPSSLTASTDASALPNEAAIFDLFPEVEELIIRLIDYSRQRARAGESARRAREG